MLVCMSPVMTRYALWELSWYPWFIENAMSDLTTYHVLLQRQVQSWPCLWNGIQKPCYLFARKFNPGTLDTLLKLFSNYSAPWASNFWSILWSDLQLLSTSFLVSHRVTVVNYNIFIYTECNKVHWHHSYSGLMYYVGLVLLP